MSHRRFIRTIDKFDLKLAYLQQRCQVWGIDFDPDAARQRALPVFECRLAAAKLDPQNAPDAGPLALFWPALRACATSTYSLRQRLLRGAWIAAVAVLPKQMATPLISWRFVVFERPQWIEGLLRRRRGRQLPAARSGEPASAKG